MTDATEPLPVIVATDGTDASLLAAHEVARLVPPDADLLLVTVADAEHDPEEDAGGIEGPAISPRQAAAEYREGILTADTALTRTAQAFGPRPIRQRVVERATESVGARLCTLAVEEGAGMIVVGSHGHRALVDVFLGSVSSYVAHHSPCPVLIVRQRPQPDS